MLKVLLQLIPMGLSFVWHLILLALGIRKEGRVENTPGVVDNIQSVDPDALLEQHSGLLSGKASVCKTGESL